MKKLLMFFIITCLFSCAKQQQLEISDFIQYFKNKNNGYIQEGKFNNSPFMAELRPQSLIAALDIGETYYQLSQNQLDSMISTFANGYEVLINSNIDTTQIGGSLNDPYFIMSLQTELEQTSLFEVGNDRAKVASCTVLPMGTSLQILYASTDSFQVNQQPYSLLINSKLLGIKAQRISFDHLENCPKLKSAL